MDCSTHEAKESGQRRHARGQCSAAAQAMAKLRLAAAAEADTRVVLAEQGLPREGTCVAVHVDPSSPEATANSVRATCKGWWGDENSGAARVRDTGKGGSRGLGRGYECPTCPCVAKARAVPGWCA